MLKEPWPDFMAFYGTSATGAGWIVPKKYIEKVGEDAYKRAPVGAGPFKFVSFTPGIELTLEAFADYWRKAPQVKRLIMRSIPDETTRAAAVKTGEVDAAYLFVGPVAEDLKRSPGVRVVAPLLYGIYWLDFLDQWDPKSPWHDRRVRQAASLAIDRQRDQPGRDARDSARRPARSCRRSSTSPCASIRPPSIPSGPSSSWSRPAIRTASTRATSPRCRPTPPWRRRSAATCRQSGSARACARWSAPRSSPPGGRRSSRGLLIGATGAAGNAATRLEAFFTKGGTYAYGTRPEIDDLFQRQAAENDRKQREALLHQIQKIVADQTLVAPIFQQAFLWGVGARVEQPGAGLIQGYPYAAPCEDLKLK